MHGAGIQVFPTSTALSYGAAEKITAILSAAHSTGGMVSLVLSGGSTPRTVYELLSSSYQKKIDWSHLHVFWGDERCVPPDSAESNFRMAHQALLRHVPIPQHHIHRMRGELPPSEAARAYEIELRNAFGLTPGDIPRFSLVLLGLGDDGHTASLFPGSSALDESKRLITETYVERLAIWRVTMTFPLLDRANHILFLVAGPTKAAIARSVIGEGRVEFPAAHFARSSGDVHWYLDRDAASLLDPTEKP